MCRDGSMHLFKRRELRYLASLIDDEEQKALLLPILLEVNAGRGEVAVMCQGEVEEKVMAKVLDMPVTPRQKKIVLYRPQLALVRKQLRTTTQYLFPPRS
jgi:uncharacterized protein (UPF0216 family)